ncbi:sorbitol dehydrogenase [Pseudomonas batumici]|uniref:Sorbitol dehydrogenase n=1 Tax=Pseudomonas batumici TaxID=226910 RepID=A0A0C2EPC7_9PSED|nr:sorbitol dehydrogenase [Pseudomonas batumici]KIH80528.1 hypothetical protein UCMB321_5737 [Pseudomonas batumici]KIH80617.1 hypothetical protein UCMB321_5648 [Pseudomonas batumici]
MSTDLENFVGLSSALLGIAADRLAPPIDSTQLASKFLAYTRPKVTVQVFNALLSQYATMVADQLTPDQIAVAILMRLGQPAPTQTAQAARAIMKLWLLGVWYQPYDVGVFKQGQQWVVSDLAYQESWAWKVAQAHPMGYSQFHFGYWSETPPSLAAFTGVSGSGNQGGWS